MEKRRVGGAGLKEIAQEVLYKSVLVYFFTLGFILIIKAGRGLPRGLLLNVQLTIRPDKRLFRLETENDVEGAQVAVLGRLQVLVEANTPVKPKGTEHRQEDPCAEPVRTP